MITTKEELKDLEIVRDEELRHLIKLEGLLHRAVDLGEDDFIDSYFNAKRSIALLDEMIAKLKR